MNIRVAKVLENGNVVINRGRIHGIKENDVFIIYEEGEDIKDPTTNESLGRLEIVKGTGVVGHLQENICTIKPITYKKREITKTEKKPMQTMSWALKSINGNQQEEIKYFEDKEVDTEFINVKVGDFLKIKK